MYLLVVSVLTVTSPMYQAFSLSSGLLEVLLDLLWDAFPWNFYPKPQEVGLVLSTLESRKVKSRDVTNLA